MKLLAFTLSLLLLAAPVAAQQPSRIGIQPCVARGAAVELPTTNIDGSQLLDLSRVEVYAVPLGGNRSPSTALAFSAPTPLAPQPGSFSANYHCQNIPTGTADFDLLWYAVDTSGNPSAPLRGTVDRSIPAAPSGVQIR